MAMQVGKTLQLHHGSALPRGREEGGREGWREGGRYEGGRVEGGAGFSGNAIRKKLSGPGAKKSLLSGK